MRQLRSLPGAMPIFRNRLFAVILASASDRLIATHCGHKRRRFPATVEATSIYRARRIAMKLFLLTCLTALNFRLHRRKRSLLRP